VIKWTTANLKAHASRAIATLGLALCFIFSALLTATSFAQTPTVNTAINNQAKATYTDALSGRAALLNSNTVSTIVGRQINFQLTASQNKQSAPGAGVLFTQSLVNLGNATESFRITFQDQFPGTFNFSQVQLFEDANSDGVPDSGTPLSTTQTLTSGQTLNFIAVAQVPTNAQTGQEDRFTVSAFAAAAPSNSQTITNTVTITAQAVIVVSKAFDVTQGPSPYDGLIVTLSYSNIGNSAASNVILTDIIGGPSTTLATDTTGMQYVANSGIWQTQPVSDANGGDPSGISYSVSTIGAITTVQATIANVQPGASGKVSFRTNIKPNLVPGIAKTTNAVKVEYFDGISSQSTRSNNSVYYRVLASGPDLVVDKTHNTAFVINNDGEFVLQVKNIGGGATTDRIVVEDRVPAGLSISAAGLPNASTSSWACVIVGVAGQIPNGVAQIVRCESRTSVGPGQNHPNPLILKMRGNQATNGVPITNRAIVTGGGEDPAYADNNSAVDAVEIVTGANVSGSAWYDINHDGKRDEQEPAAEKMIVELVDSTGVVVASTFTGTNGGYQFTNIAPGESYKILFRFPEGSNALASSPVSGERGQVNPSSNAIISKGIIDGLTLKNGDNVIEQSLRLDPSGVVYDSATRQPIAGATVRLVGPAGFRPTDHLVGGIPNVVQITGSTGMYQFILLGGAPVGLYQLEVTAPAGYYNEVSPSIRPAKSVNCPQIACLDPTGLAAHLAIYSVQPANIYTAPPLGQDTTYYLSFYIDVNTDPEIINNHIPLDPITANQPGLFVEKTVNRPSAEFGETVVYTVRIVNRSKLTATQVSVVDRTPLGFKYLPGTAKLNGVAIVDPIISNNALLGFRNLGNVAGEATSSLTYAMRLVPGAQDGDGINRAQAFAGNTASNVATVKVKVNPGIFSTRGILMGKVFLDCDRNHVQGREELGIPGVRLFLQDGTFVITDSEGKYSFIGLAPRSHVVKIDSLTLPERARMTSISNRHSGVGTSAFVDLKNGELHRADFTEFSCSDTVVAQVYARRKKGEVFSIEAERLFGQKLEPSGKANLPSDPKSLPASGVSSGSVINNDSNNAAKLEISTVQTRGLSTQEFAQRSADQLNNTLGFIDLKTGDTLPIAQTNIRIKGITGAQLQLSVNGKLILQERIGTKTEVAEKQLQVLEYIGVALEPGKNQLSLKQMDNFGNARGEVNIELIAPDRAGKIVIQNQAQTAIANGVTPTKITVSITDASGVPVTARTPIKLEVSHGRFNVEDSDRNEPGIQTFVTDGKAEFFIIPPLEPVQARIKISSGLIAAEHNIYFLPDLRPLVANGILEGVLSAKRFNGTNLIATRANDGFEQTLRRFSAETGINNNQKQAAAAAAAAFFLKGKVKGEYLLTLAYDSEKDTRERLFRDIQPNEYYPVYGDSSVKGFDAQSTSRLYIRVDKQKSWLLWGDFSTNTTQNNQKLGAYQRSLTGVKQHYESNGITAEVFASKDNVRQLVKELAANGTSGPYEFLLNDALINSERIELIVRDRNQPAVILSSKPLVRFIDYGFEPLTGRLLLRAPQASVDANLNPISLRITAEIEQGGNKFWVYGANAQVQVSDQINIGATIVRNENPIAENFEQLSSVNAELKLGEKTKLALEVASTNKADGQNGQAARLELAHETNQLRLRINAMRADPSFDNPAAPISKGRQEISAKAEYDISSATRLRAEVIQTKDTVLKTERDGVLLNAEHSFGNNTSLEVGVRHVRDKTNATSTAVSSAASVPSGDVTSVRAKLQLPIPRIEAASAYLEAEVDVSDSSKRMIAIGGEYALTGKGKLYARHEFESSLAGGFSLNAAPQRSVSVLGLSADYMDNGSLFTEYRGRDAFGVRTTEAAIGLKNWWSIADGLRLTTSAERIQVLSGAKDQESSALSLGLDYTKLEHLKASTRLEWRDSTTTKSWLHSVDGAYKINRDWTGLLRHIVNINDTKQTNRAAASQRFLQRSQVGAAWRETDLNRINALFLLELKREKDSALFAESSNRRVAQWSSSVNWKPNYDTTIAAGYASKWVKELIAGVNQKSTVDRVNGRATWDFAEGWDASILGSVMRERTFKVRQSSLGFELGRQVKTNLWLSLGYNKHGYTDRDTVGADSTEKGIFLRLRYKFDEQSFGRNQTEPSDSK
jgi:large repetitive protein